MLFLSSQLLKIQDLNIVNLCSYMTHANDPDRFLKTADGFTFSLEERFFAVEFSHYAGSTEPTKNLDLDIMHKIQDGEQVNRSDVTKFVRARFHNVTDQQVFKVSVSHVTKTLPKPVGSHFLDDSSSHSFRHHVFSVFACAAHETTVHHVTTILKTVHFVCLTVDEVLCFRGSLPLFTTRMEVMSGLVSGDGGLRK
jgi:hypothetical protein